jgi:hypothetical protein
MGFIRAAAIAAMLHCSSCGEKGSSLSHNVVVANVKAALHLFFPSQLSATNKNTAALTLR